jgi:hypothetical protein
VFRYSSYAIGTVSLSEWNVNNSMWSEVLNDPVNGFVNGGYIHAIAQNDSFFYIAGKFMFTGSSITHNIAKWDGTNWYPLGEGDSNCFTFENFQE